MGDYEEQQSMEIEALESILMDDLKDISDDVPSGWKPQGKIYSVEVAPQLEDVDPSDYPVISELVFSHTLTYPDEPPLVKARSVRGMTDQDVADLQSLLDAQVEENIGMPMIYTLLTAAQEWINSIGLHKSTPVLDPEAEKKKRQEEEEARIAAIRAHGTPVTPETFESWRIKFEAEMELARSSLGETAVVVPQGKLSGRKWFLQQEAQHLSIEEPLLEDDDEGSDWSRENSEELAVDDDYESSEGDLDEDEMLDSFLEEKQ